MEYKLNITVKGLGFVFIILGIIWSLLSKFMCGNLCRVCSGAQLIPCNLLFLFVGIILVVDGLSLIKLYEENAD